MTTKRLLIVCALALLAAGRVAATIGPAEGATRRIVYFSATDAKGAAVTDLKPADLIVKEGGKDRPIASVMPATAPMQIAILVDDAGTGAFQVAILQFLQVTVGHAQFAISILNPQPRKLVNYIDDVPGLNAAIQQLGPRGRVAVDGDQIIEAIVDTTKELRQREAPRPVILVLSASGESEVAERADYALKELRDSRAGLNVLHVTGIELGRVLGDGPKQSGGMVQQVNGNMGLGPVLAKIADHLVHQYVLTYDIPAGTKLNEKVSITTSRKGVTLLAPSRLPEK
jgi:hypothetical protein